MRNFLTIWRREFTACFLSPVAYVTMVVFLAVVNGTFFVGVLKNLGSHESLSALLFSAIFLWLPMLITVITMRLFSEEKRVGTLETLLTAPVSEAQVVMGKYFGALSFILTVVAPTVASVFLLERLSPGITLVDVDVGAVSAGCIILVLCGAFFCALGLLMSLLTTNQVISAICCFAAISLTLLLGWLLSSVPGVPKGVADYVSLTSHVEDFARGWVGIGPPVLCLSGTALLLFAAVAILESRQWKP